MAYHKNSVFYFIFSSFSHAIVIESFNSKERAWLVIWELEILLELPVGVLLFFPSALFYHFNIDITGEPTLGIKSYLLITTCFCLDLEVISSDQFPDITKRGDYPQWCDDAEGRGSLVWFNQASMIQSACLNSYTVQEAKKTGINTATDFLGDVDKYFTPATPFKCPLPTHTSE